MATTYTGTDASELFYWFSTGDVIVFAGGGDDRIDNSFDKKKLPGNDTLVGGLGRDIISSGAGDDVIYGDTDSATSSVADVIANGDSLLGGSGNDQIHGGGGVDYVNGESGDDNLYGDAGNDFLQGGTGVDRIYGGAANDIIYGGSTNPLFSYNFSIGLTRDGITGEVYFAPLVLSNQTGDTESADASRNWMYGGDGDDQLFGSNGSDVMHGDAGNDVLFGGDDGDYVYGGDGNDTLIGHGGDDTFHVTSSADGFDAVDGGSGFDRIIATANNAVVGLQSVTGIEQISANGFSGVSIAGSAEADTLNFSAVTLSGITLINGGDGADTIIGPTGAKGVILGGGGNDQLAGGSISDYLDGGTGNDTVDGGHGSDTLHGRAGNDTLYGGAGSNVVYGEEGNDQIYSGAGSEIIDGGAGRDTLRFESASTPLTVNLLAGTSQGNGKDQLISIESVTAGSGNDTVIGNALVNALAGAAGNDELSGGAGGDRLQGDGGNDVLFGGTGNDNLHGGTGADQFVYRTNERWDNDKIRDFEDGIDRLDFSGQRLTVASFTITASGADAIVTYNTNGDAITLTGMAGKITADDFFL